MSSTLKIGDTEYHIKPQVQGLFGYSEAQPYVTHLYPMGGRNRSVMEYWTETADKGSKRGEHRMARRSPTKPWYQRYTEEVRRADNDEQKWSLARQFYVNNPPVAYSKPSYSNYFPCLLMYLDSKAHVQIHQLGTYSGFRDWFAAKCMLGPQIHDMVRERGQSMVLLSEMNGTMLIDNLSGDPALLEAMLIHRYVKLLELALRKRGAYGDVFEEFDKMIGFDAEGCMTVSTGK